MPTEDICPDCGEPLDEQHEFDWRADMIQEALDEIPDSEQWMELALLSLFAGRFLARIRAEDRRRARKDLIQAIDESTKADVIAGCDA